MCLGILEGIWGGITDVARHQLKHRELFLSRQMETFRIDAVRGKCTVTVLNDLESIMSYLKEEDRFYYSMVYDPNQKTLMVDKGRCCVCCCCYYYYCCCVVQERCGSVSDTKRTYPSSCQTLSLRTPDRRRTWRLPFGSRPASPMKTSRSFSS